MTRTPEVIYEEIRTTPRPHLPHRSIEERLAQAEASVAHCARIHELWGELADTLCGQADVPPWGYSAALGAACFAHQRLMDAKEDRDRYQRLTSEAAVSR
jgi:hypothetical protein